MFRKNTTEEWIDALKEFIEPMKTTWKNGYIKGYEDAAEEFTPHPDEIYDPSNDIEESYQSGYRMGEQSGWAFMWKISQMPQDDFAEAFGGCKCVNDLLRWHTFEEAFQMYMKWAKEHEDE